MEAVRSVAPSHTPPRPRFPAALCYTIEGDLRYLSNHDEIRLLTRAVVRADWPLAYSQGFNPKPRVRLPWPRPVGAASLCEIGLVDLCAELGAAELAAGLVECLPGGCRLLGVLAPAPTETPHPQAARYSIALSPDEARQAAAGLAGVLRAGELPVRRSGAPDRPVRTVDIRPFIDGLRLEDGRLILNLKIDRQRTARCGEVLTLLQLPGDALQHRIVLEQIDWDVDYAGWITPAKTRGSSIG